MALAGALCGGGGCALTEGKADGRRGSSAHLAVGRLHAHRAHTLRTCALRVACAARDAGVGAESSRSRSLGEGAPRRRSAAPPPPAPPRPEYDMHQPTVEQRRLNEALRSCKSADAVLALVSSNWDVLNEVNVSTALAQVRNCVGKQSAWLEGDKRFLQLLGASESLFECMKPATLAYAFYACGALNVKPPAYWLERYWSVSVSELPRFEPKGLCSVLFACGRLGITPPDSWLSCLWDTSISKLGDFTTPAFSQVLYACGRLRVTPPDYWLERFWEASAAKLGELNAQDCSNMLYACGRLGITPPDDWLLRYWHASALKLGDFKPQELCNTLYACGQLRALPPDYWLERHWHVSAAKLGDYVPAGFSNTWYACRQLSITPPDFWLLRFWHFSAPRLVEFNGQNLCNLLYACSLLRVSPSAEWMQLFSDACERALPDMKQQDMASIALALASLGVWHVPVRRSLWARLCKSLSRNIAGWSADDQLHARQLHQTYQAAALEPPGFLPEPSPELRAAARKCWVDRLETENNTSKFHEDVSAHLTLMGIAHANQRWCEGAERWVDIAIDRAPRPVAVQVDGPMCFLQDGRQTGAVRMRNRLLTAHGWCVAVVSYSEWSELTTDAQRRTYLGELLEHFCS